MVAKKPTAHDTVGAKEEATIKKQSAGGFQGKYFSLSVSQSFRG